jgi:hypothetical protein
MEFSLLRFWLLTRKQWIENRKLYLFGTLALIGILSFFIILIIAENRNGFSIDGQHNVFFIGLIAAGAFFSSTPLKLYEEKQKSIQAFMIPASVIEKYLVAVVYTMIFFPLVYLIITYPLILLGHYIDLEVFGRFNALYTFNLDQVATSTFIFFAVQSCFLLFSLVFHRYAFLKTTVLVSVLLMSCLSFNEYMAKTMLGNTQPRVLPTGNFDPTVVFAKHKGPHRFSFSEATPYSGITMNSSGDYQWKIKLPKSKDIAFKLYLFAISPFIWLITFLRLREKQL